MSPYLHGRADSCHNEQSGSGVALSHVPTHCRVLVHGAASSIESRDEDEVLMSPMWNHPNWSFSITHKWPNFIIALATIGKWTIDVAEKAGTRSTSGKAYRSLRQPQSNDFLQGSGWGVIAAASLADSRSGWILLPNFSLSHAGRLGSAVTFARADLHNRFQDFNPTQHHQHPDPRRQSNTSNAIPPS